MQYWNPLPILNWRKWAGHPTKLIKSLTFLPALGTQKIPFSLPVAKPIPENSELVPVASDYNYRYNGVVGLHLGLEEPRE
jgi:hypothetical protein